MRQSDSATTNRRRFLGASLGLCGLDAALPHPARAAAQSVGPMKITKIDAVRCRRDLRIQGVSPNWTWVRLYTDQIFGRQAQLNLYMVHLCHNVVRELVRLQLEHTALRNRCARLEEQVRGGGGTPAE